MHRSSITLAVAAALTFGPWFWAIRCLADTATILESTAVVRASNWQLYRTANFCVRSRNSRDQLQRVARLCEDLRCSMQTAWSGSHTPMEWVAPCDVVLHTSLREYQLSLGQGVGQSVGCTTLSFDSDKVVARRIDLRVDATNWMHDALPHELTHIVLADLIPRRQLPRWADEGLSVLSESEWKRKCRWNAMQRAMDVGAYYDIPSLFAVASPPPREWRASFYGQSAALVHFLLGRGTFHQFLVFLRQASGTGHDRALARVYGIKDTNDLVRLIESAAQPAERDWAKGTTLSRSLPSIRNDHNILLP